MRLTLTRHTHPDHTIVAAATVILEKLRKSRIEPFPDLHDYLAEKKSGAEVLFPSALNLLFLLGAVEYRSKIDSIEYIGP